MEAITREEKLMSGQQLEPITRKELFLAKAAGMDVQTPEPITRAEIFLSKISGGGSAPVVEPLTVTENGTYTAPSGVDGYNPVTVNVASGIKYGVEFLQSDGYGAPKSVKIYGCPYQANSSSVYVPGYMFYRQESSSGSWGASLETVILDNQITHIGNYAFYKCMHLKNITLPTALTRIGTNAFYSCKLNSITFKGTPTTIATTAFSQCSDLLTINVPWAEGEVSGAPWGATNATINYNYTGG